LGFVAGSRRLDSMSIESGAGCDQSKQIPGISVTGPNRDTSQTSIGYWLEPRHRMLFVTA
ncbi:MAG: hypothetical protein ACXWPK_14350, partial [Isosphaeraceae bacterium]